MHDDTRVRSIGDFTADAAATSRHREWDRAEALRSIIGDAQVVYALRLHDGIIKIGCTSDLRVRRNDYRGSEIIGFAFGDYELEAEIHALLTDHVARGREYYHPTPDVIEVVNEMRESFGMPHLAA